MHEAFSGEGDTGVRARLERQNDAGGIFGR